MRPISIKLTTLRRINKMDRENLTHDMIELLLYVQNNAGRAYYEPAYKTLGKFHKANSYNLDRAIAYIDRYCLLPAAKQFLLEFGTMTDAVKYLFPKSDRLKLAEVMALEMIGEFKLGNY
jgi:hypothetical protein